MITTLIIGIQTELTYHPHFQLPNLYFRGFMARIDKASGPQKLQRHLKSQRKQNDNLDTRNGSSCNTIAKRNALGLPARR